METGTGKNAFLLWVLVLGLVSQNLVIPVLSRSFEDQKTYYSPDPHTGTTPGGSHKSPPHGHGGSYTPTPSTGGGSGGYYHSPPTSGGGHSTPVIITPPSSPLIDPGTPTIPGISTPPPTPLFPDPNTPPFFTGTCNYWRTHPEAIFAILGWWGTVGGVFGVASTPTFGTSLSLQQALANTRIDGIGALYREGTASLLNSMVSKTTFPFTTKQVKDHFAAAIGSNKVAAAQAELFKMANEGRLKPRA